MTTATPTPDILSDVIQPADPTFHPEFARLVLQLRLTDAATDRLRTLLQRNNAGTITAEDKTDLDQMMLQGQFIDLMQAKARLSLRQSDNSAR